MHSYRKQSLSFSRALTIFLFLVSLAACGTKTSPTVGPLPISTDTQVPKATDTPLPTPISILRVGGLGEYKTIQSAVDSALDGDTIQVAQGTYTENVAINKSKSITLQGGWSPDFSTRSDDRSLTIIDGGARDSVLNIQAGAAARFTVEIEGFTIQNGNAENGGGINVRSNGKDSHPKLILINNTIRTNRAKNEGGGILAVSFGLGATTDLVLTNNIITGNSGVRGGGMHAKSVEGGHIVANLTDNDVSSNVVTEFAGGIYLNSSGKGSQLEVTITRNVISHNTGATIDAGGIAVYASDSDATTTLVMQNNLILNNEAGFGGGMVLYAWGSQARVNLALTNNIIAGNNSRYGAGYFAIAGQTDENTKPGGSVFIQSTNNTITGNQGEGSGGIDLHSGSTFGDGGLISLFSKNDIVWGNTDSQQGLQVNVVVEPGKAGVATADASYSDIGLIGTWGAGTYVTDHVIKQDPLFSDPKNQDFSLRDGSPAIDTGDPDLEYNDGIQPPGRGTKRADMGAYGGPKNQYWFDSR